jgi:hypothetical protein
LVLWLELLFDVLSCSLVVFAYASLLEHSIDNCIIVSGKVRDVPHFVFSLLSCQFCQGVYPLRISSYERQVLSPFYSEPSILAYVPRAASCLVVTSHEPRRSPSETSVRITLVSLYSNSYIFTKSRYRSVGSDTSADTRRYQAGPWTEMMPRDPYPRRGLGPTLGNPAPRRRPLPLRTSKYGYATTAV